ncbi:MAG: hypothetical protein ACUVTU_07300 [Desulfurispora sp.]|uniref:hypothetical protein n=1 Tax=Desulfurispora TaxID=510701 RepID=UPI0003712074|nr:hypothetical protein [Desulfurispora thermophila]
MKEDKNKESKTAGLLKAAFYALAAAAVYYLVFRYNQQMMQIITSKTIKAPLLTMATVVVVAYLYGTAVAKFIKHTLEEKLSSQSLREE